MKKISKEEQKNYIPVLEKSFLFKNTSGLISEFVMVDGRFQWESYTKGEIIYDYNNYRNSLAVILKGRVSVMKNSRGRVLINTLKAGEAFGGSVLFSRNESFIATVKAEGQCVLLFISKELMEEILLPHEAIIRTAGSQVVMTGYHTINDIKCVANKWLQQDLLRMYVGFDGLTVSDYGSIPQIGDSLSSLVLCASAMNAGNEVDFPTGDTYAHISEALDKGLVSESTLEKAVKHVLMLKAKLGMLDNAARLYSKRHIEFDTDEERTTSYQLATQSIVLLKNGNVDGNKETLLPLTAEKLSALGGRVMLTGPNANSMWALAGDYTFQAMRYFWKNKEESAYRPKYVLLKDGMEQRMPKGATLIYSRGCDWTEVPETVMEVGGDPRVAEQRKIDRRMVDSHEFADWDEALRMAHQCDVIVAAMARLFHLKQPL